jgi:hypothetical protein
VLLLALAARLATTPGRRTAALRLLIASLAVTMAADTLFSALALSGSATVVTDGLYLIDYLLLGAAGLHPSMAGLSEPARRQVARLERGRLLAMAATVAATACDALAKATKKASPWVSTSRPSRSRKHSRSRHRWSARAPP